MLLRLLHSPRLRPRTFAFRALWAGLIVCMVASMQSCGPHIKATPEQIAALPREFVDVHRPVSEPSRTLSYLHVGDPDHQRVIFVHGTPGNADDYADYLVDAIPDMEVVAVDRLGFGRSFPGEHGAGQKIAPGSGVRPRATGVVASFREQAESIAPLLVKQNGRWPILVGHSLGGPIVARIAADYPDKVDSVVILAGSLDPSLEELHWYNDVAQWIVIKPLLPLALVHSNEEILQAKAQTLELAPVLRKIRCPVIVIHGDADTLVPYANTIYIKRELVNCPNLQVITLPHENHFIPWLHSAEVRAAVARLAKRPE